MMQQIGPPKQRNFYAYPKAINFLNKKESIFHPIETISCTYFQKIQFFNRKIPYSCLKKPISYTKKNLLKKLVSKLCFAIFKKRYTDKCQKLVRVVIQVNAMQII